jgi:hypothetical protein
MTWLMERGSDLLMCEIRHAPHESSYEFEITGTNGDLSTHRFASPTDLIDTYLHTQSQLRALGWRPRNAELDVIS